MSTPRFVWIHGMGEKPPAAAEREAAWRALESALWMPIPSDTFEVAYWADIRRPAGANGGDRPGELLAKLPAQHRAALEFAYVTDLTGDQLHSGFAEALFAVPQRKGLSRTVRGLRDYAGKPHLLAINAVEGAVQSFGSLRRRLSWRTQRRMLQALMYFYRDMQPYLAGVTRPAILERIGEQLRAATDRPLCVVSQSMGTLVALDAVYRNSDIPIDTFVTLGSPLGIRYFRERLWGRPAFPPNVRRWYNLYDGLDNVACWDRNLRDDYPGVNGERRIIDRQIRDNYNPDGLRDPHDWYAYLACPELADVMCHFWIGTNEAIVPPGLAAVERQN